jgi:type I restriction enzyme S subunit
MIANLEFIPKGWVKVKISEVLFFQEGPGVRKWQFTESGIKLLNVGNINKGKIDLSKTKIHLSKEEATGKYAHFLVNEGDLLIACSGIVVNNFHNKIAFAKKEHLPLCLNTSTMRFKSLDDSFDLNYFKYFLQSVHFTSQLRKLITGSAQLNFGPSHIRKIELLLPPFKTQQRIAKILNDAEKLKQKTEKLLKDYDNLAQSIFLDMFGDIQNNVKFQKWIVSDFALIVRDGPHVSPEYSITGIPILSTRNIRPFKLIMNDVKFVSPEMFKKLTQKFKPQKDDILITKGGTTGYAKKVDWEWDFCIWVHLASIRIDKNLVNSTYVEAALNTYYCYRQSQELTRGIANKDLGLKRLINIELPKPPLELQNQFAEKIALIEQQKELAKQELKESEELFNCLMQKAFKGELA